MKNNILTFPYLRPEKKKNRKILEQSVTCTVLIDRKYFCTQSAICANRESLNDFRSLTLLKFLVKCYFLFVKKKKKKKQ